MALVASSLTGVRGERTLFSDVSFTLQPGEALWVCGSNGSGKTTLLRMLCGLLPPAGGQIRWRGAEICNSREQFLQEMVHIGHECALKDDLSALENLAAIAGIAGHATGRVGVEAALARMGLERQAGLPAHVLSQGQRKRAALARLFLPPVRPLWILDEPFSALDAAAATLLDDTVASHLAGGGMLVYTTHQAPGFAGRSARRLELDAVAAC
ncbi:MAG TPA: cytochrome c biogenesis heme-transporting ATPase CcmA [Telluria sp.]